MHKQEALIEIHRGPLPPFGTVVTTYAWLGERHWPVWLDPDDLSKLPWHLVPIGEFDFARREQCYIRADAFWAWLPLKLEFWLHKHWEWFYVRCIVTLAVWGLADYDRAKHPSWRDIRWPWRKS